MFSLSDRAFSAVYPGLFGCRKLEVGGSRNPAESVIDLFAKFFCSKSCIKYGLSYGELLVFNVTIFQLYFTKLFTE